MENFQIPVAGHENDKVIIMTRRHVASMLGVIFIIMIMVLLPIFIVTFALNVSPSFISGYLINFMVIIGAVYYLIVATFAFTQWLSFYYDIFIVTDKEILDIDQAGLFDRRVTEVSILRIQDVSARIKGFFPTFFGYGDIVAESAGENSRTYIIENVPRPVEIANQILTLHNEHIEREDRAVELITAEGDLRAHSMNLSTRTDNSSDKPPIIEKPCEPCPVCPPDDGLAQPTSGSTERLPDLSQPSQDVSQGEVKSDDLNSGGEIKL